MRTATSPEMAPPTLLGWVVLLAATPFLLVQLLPASMLWKLNTADFLVFHNVAEFFSVMVSLSIFGIGWYTFDQSRDRHALFLATSFLAIGLMDFMHTLSYAGMPAFITPNDPNKPTQFWLAVRFFSAATLLGSAWISRDSGSRLLCKTSLMVMALSVAALVCIGIVFFPELIPAAYVQGKGLTPFKKNSEYLIVSLLAAAYVMYWRRLSKTGDRSILYYLSAFVFCIFGELVFAIYRSVFDVLNMLGHCYKIVAFFLIYRGIFVSSVHAPYRKLAATRDRLQAEIAERRQREAEIRLLKNYLANIIDSMPTVLVGMDAQQTVTQWNRQAEAVTGIAARDAVGRPATEVLPDFSPWIEALRDEVAKRRPRTLEKLLIEKRGEWQYYDLTCYPLIANCVEGAVLQIANVTERSRIQELMVQTEKMMSVGGLAAGMAHEINNPLGIITQAAQNLERRVSPGLAANLEAAQAVGISIGQLQAYFERRQITAFIDSIREASARASHIIANILRFSRSTDQILKPASLPEILEQSLELAGNDYDLKKRFDFRSIRLVREYPPDLPGVPLVAVEIEQVALNLLKNAAQAMFGNPPERPPTIVLRLRLEERYALIEVEDNGPGMEESVRRRVFEPFFTTKEPGIGTGLGLSVSYMIVTRNHKGLMTVESAPGAGARFMVRLPLERENGHG